MAKMLLGAAIFGLAISIFYLAVSYLAFSLGLSVPSRNRILELIKIRKTVWGNIFQIILVVTILSVVLYLLYLSTQYYGYKVVVAVAMLASWSAVYVMTEITFLHIGFSKIVSRSIGIFAAFLIIYLWFYYFNWIISDFVALVLAAFFLLSFKRISIIQSLVIGAAMVIYDVIAVFGTGVMMKFVKGIIPHAPAVHLPATTGVLPILMVVPAALSLKTYALFLIGLGDVIIPGLIVVTAIKQARRFGSILMVFGVLSGYIAGIVFSVAVFHLTGAAQPATIYLIPGVVLGFLLAALYCGKVKEVFITKEGPD